MIFLPVKPESARVPPMTKRPVPLIMYFVSARSMFAGMTYLTTFSIISFLSSESSTLPVVLGGNNNGGNALWLAVEVLNGDL